ncbi:hypothetical protein BCR36DRAFT_329362 [Piromyces finnis]|uniref:peptidylprolyl isomerase n=1 Tax=Piromyces finnis TaxID=1754191 RepID=A0A1Y1V7J0_9FUNG|nr:hypothetical protein BCR36DRAFT_329362 [Piromyces finnis]|eukprot:ORX48376.1 hypothetical protein BCR36DRAFT_329362 [Piromyces finnis]
MFWGLKIMPGKTYTQKVEYPFKVTMACLGQEPILGRHCLYVRVENQDYMLCSLNFGQNEQQSLNLVFSPGEEIVFHSVGNGPIYLSGMYDVDDYDDDDDMDEDEEMYENEEEEDDDEEEDEEIDEEELKKLKADAKKTVAQPKKQTEKKAAAPAKEEKKPVEKKAAAPAKEEKKPVEKKAAAPAKEEKKPAEKKVAAPAKEEKKPEPAVEKAPKKKTLQNGLVIEDITVGTGARAKAGKRVGVRYIGKLAKNGKVFDKNTKGAVFKFNLGKGEVIKGWDLGVNGMNVGGVRRLTIPANLAYGSRGAPPDIPPNSTLIFEVKMMTVGK